MVFPDPFTAAVVQGVLLLLLVRFLDVYEREPLWILALMAAWGALGATTISAIGNGVVSGLLSEDVDAVWGAAISAPLVEECAKGLALLAALYAARWGARRLRIAEFNGPTDGMVYGIAVGLGFAFAENNLYFLSEPSFGEGYATLQLREGFLNIGTLGHGIYTGLFGLGLGLATWSSDRVTRVALPLCGLALGMFLHAFNNGLISAVLVREFGFRTTADALSGKELPADVIERIERSAQSALEVILALDYVLAAVFVLALVAWTVWQRQILVRELRDETSSGVVAERDVQLTARYATRVAWYARLALKGDLDRLRAARRAHHEIAELAFAKWRQRVAGGETAVVELHRRNLRRMRADEESLLS